LLLDEYVDAAERKKAESTITTRMVCKYALGKEGGNYAKEERRLQA
jgi:hypothetical protein